MHRRFRCPHPDAGLDAYRDALRQAIAELGADVLLPLNDYATIAVSRLRADLQGCVGLALPPAEALDLARNRFETIQLGRHLGIPTPPTWLARDSTSLAEIAGRVRYPCVAKLLRGAGGVGMRLARSPDELLGIQAPSVGPGDSVYDASAYVIQEWLTGEIHDVCALFRHGEPIAALAQKRRLMYPPEGGVGVWNETVVRPDLLELAFVLLRALNWHGPAQVEFLVNERNEPCLIEINGRFWGTLDLAIAAGIDFPSLTCLLAIDKPVDPMWSYREIVGFCWPVPLGCLAALFSDDPLANLRRVLLPDPRTRTDLRLSDPLPHLAEVVYLVQRAFRRRSLLTGAR